MIESTRLECLGCGISREEVETFEEKQLMEQLIKRAKEEGKR